MKKLNDLYAIIMDQNSIRITDLEQMTKIPRSSLLRYLKKLEEQGKVVKFFGEVAIRKSSIESNVFPRINSSVKIKQQIAKRAAQHIKNNDVIFIDAGSTTYYLARELFLKKITIYTNNLLLTNIINDNYQPKVYYLPGLVNPKTLSIASTETIISIEAKKFDKCFIGMNSFNHDRFYTTNQEEAIVKQSAIKATTKGGAFVLGRHSKVNETAKFAFALKSQIKLISEKGGS